MALLEWGPRLSVGVDDMDFQHHKLVDLVNELHNAMLRGEAREMMEPVLEDLLQYTATHFTTEEALMRRHGYPDLASHILEHQKLTTEVRRFQSEYRTGRMALSVTVLQFLRDWLQNHIQKTDKQYGMFLNGKGVR